MRKQGGFKRGNDRPNERSSGTGRDKKSNDRPFKRSSEDKPNREDKPFREKKDFKERGRKPFQKDRNDRPRPERKERTFENDRPNKPFREKRDSADGERKPFREKRDSRDGERKPFREKRDSANGERKPFRKDRPFDKDRNRDSRSDKPRRSFDRDEKPVRKERSSEREEGLADKPERSFNDKPYSNNKKKSTFKEYRKRGADRSERPYKERETERERPYKERETEREGTDFSNEDSRSEKRSYRKDKPEYKKVKDRSSKGGLHENKVDDGLIRLNKYIANSGICSRREADKLIESGAIKVNGKVVTELGFKINPSDIINYGGETLKREKHVYVLVNKPKDYITTSDDPDGRRTVLDLIRGACRERLYPVGRLDRNTTGVLLMTNDGDLTKKLTHPSFGAKKIYHVTLDKPLKHEDLKHIEEGIELEDGTIKPDEIHYVGDGRDKTEIGIELHSGRNRIVRRIFESLEYRVIKLDRVVFAGLTKKDLPRGRWRLLTDKEVGYLKMQK